MYIPFLKFCDLPVSFIMLEYFSLLHIWNCCSLSFMTIAIFLVLAILLSNIAHLKSIGVDWTVMGLFFYPVVPLVFYSKFFIRMIKINLLSLINLVSKILKFSSRSVVFDESILFRNYHLVRISKYSCLLMLVAGFLLRCYSILHCLCFHSFYSSSQILCQCRGIMSSYILNESQDVKYSYFHVPWYFLLIRDLPIPKIILSLINPFIWCFPTCEVLLQTLFYLNLMVNHIDR